jgi:hypothetical protein
MEIEKLIMTGQASHEVVILEKQNLYAILAFTATTDGSEFVLGRNDPRHEPPCRYSRQDSYEAGKKRLEGSVRHSLANGWRVVWRGFPYGRANN